MKQKQIFLNAVTTFAQVLGSAAALFFLYRFLVRTIGVQRLGIWSLVLATTSAVTLANQGFSTSVTKFVAKYAAREQPGDVSSLVQTALISLGAAVGILSLALYPAAKWLLGIILPHARLAEAVAILPFALASLWINILAGTLQAGLAGHELITHRNYVVLGISFAYLALSFLLVPRYSLLGLAYSQVTVAAASFFITWLLLRRRIAGLPFFPRRLSRALFREMLAYGLHFQFITISQAVREPVTKALLTKFGGLEMTGLYDMAMRWVVTFRELIVQANQVLLPTVAGLQERDPQSIPRVYRESYRLIFFLAIPCFAFLMVMSPVVSRIWLGHYDRIFVGFVALLACGWLVNVLANPAYVMDLGTGRLRWVSIGCATTGILNATLGFLGGKYFGGMAVVASVVISLMCGYLIVLASYHRENGVLFTVLLPRESAGIAISSLAGAAIFLPFFRASTSHALFSMRAGAGLLAALMCIIIVPMWIHPLRKRLMHWVFTRLPA